MGDEGGDGGDPRCVLFVHWLGIKSVMKKTKSLKPA